MRLFEHRDFEQAILNAEEHFRSRGLRASIIEKDYYVTEALRCIAASAGDRVIFKGGTSLSKGWNLIQRFSEDIDIFFDPETFSRPLGGNAINRELKQLRDAVSEHPALTVMDKESQTIGGFGRNDRFSFSQRFGGPGEIANRILLEAGTASGRQPIETRQIQSLIGQFLRETGKTLGADDEVPFPMRLLHFRRTFVEKMFAIHSKVELLKRDGRQLGSYARHYYDLYRLSDTPDVVAMLRSDEYSDIKADYDRISSTHFPRNYHPPDGLRFADSDALFPTASLSNIIGVEYEAQCRMLCYSHFPSWSNVLARFAGLRVLL